MNRSRLLAVVAAVTLLLVVLFMAGLADRLPLQQWRQALRDAGALGSLLFLAVGVLSVAVGLPRQLLAGVGGYAYGVVAGVLLSLLAAILGCALTVLFARRFLAAPIAERYARQADWLARLARDDLFLKILFMRLQPFGTNLATNLAAGVLRLHLPTFLLASLFGYVPQMLVFALAGRGIAIGSRTEVAVAAVLFAVSLLLAGVIWKRHRTDMTERDAID